MSTRLRLERDDGRVFLDRWGVEGRLGGVFLHRMEAPDPGVDLHDHPWWFASLILWGGYDEERASTREAPDFARIDDQFTTGSRGHYGHRRWLSIRALRLDECHRIVALERRINLSLVIHGPRRRSWGFYLPSGFRGWRAYEASPEGVRRGARATVVRGSKERDGR